MYTCFAANEIGTGKSNSITVDVKGGLPILRVKNKTYESVYGNEVTLDCDIKSDPSISNVYWTKEANGIQTIINQRSVGYQGITPAHPSLTITYATIYDNGKYTCFGTNAVGTSNSEPTIVNVIGDLPEVFVYIKKTEISFGDSVILGCQIKASPTHDFVYWEHNVTGVVRRLFRETLGIEGITVDNPTLSLKYATNNASGLYTCFARNVVGTSYSSAINVSVKGGVPEVNVDVRSYNTTYGKEIRLDCKITAHPQVLFVYWQKESNNRTTTLYKGSVGTDGIALDFPSLILSSPISTDSGIYTCFASNNAGTQKSLPTTLIVTGGIPTVSIPSHEYTVTYGKDITMNCIVVSNPLHTEVFWHKFNDEGQMKSINNRTQGISCCSLNNPSLTINFATPSDEGIYSCLAGNAVGVGQSQRTKLTVIAGLPIVSVNFNELEFRAGFSAIIHCGILSKLAIEKVYWQIDINNSTIVINKDSTFMGIKGSTVHNPSLLIQKASVAMSGKYVCFATNAVGTGSSAAMTLRSIWICYIILYYNL
ncbi:hypothetical protein AM593_10437, partial [Mytilus galloprovincialis]